MSYKERYLKNYEERYELGLWGLYRRKLVTALPTFMNTCKDGSCGCTGKDIVPPTEFEVAAMSAMESIDTINRAPYHYTQQRAVLKVIRDQIDTKLAYYSSFDGKS